MSPFKPEAKIFITNERRKSPGYRYFMISLIALTSFSMAAAGVLIFDYYRYTRSAEPGIKQETLAAIEKGMSFNGAVDALARDGLISNPRYFRVLGRMKGAETRIQAGEYTLRPGMTPLAILDTIIRGDITKVTLRVPEGLTVSEIGKKLESLGPWTAKSFIAAAQDKKKAAQLAIPVENLEGYLFPATYELKMSMTEPDVVDLMLARGQRERTKEREKKAKDAGLSWHQVLTLASLVEEEAIKTEEMPTIAGVFKNRIDKNMRLQSDPTAVYGLEDFKGPIKKTDLLRVSPYNTYLHKGLPPGPICNPGAAAIDAALNPEKTEYLYFVADGEGGHMFSESYIEHRANIKKYKKVLKEFRESKKKAGRENEKAAAPNNDQDAQNTKPPP